MIFLFLSESPYFFSSFIIDCCGHIDFIHDFDEDRGEQTKWEGIDHFSCGFCLPGTQSCSSSKLVRGRALKRFSLVGMGQSVFFFALCPCADPPTRSLLVYALLSQGSMLGGRRRTTDGLARACRWLEP
jgi:hypothetical protein